MNTQKRKFFRLTYMMSVSYHGSSLDLEQDIDRDDEGDEIFWDLEGEFGSVI